MTLLYQRHVDDVTTLQQGCDLRLMKHVEHPKAEGTARQLGKVLKCPAEITRETQGLKNLLN